VRLDLASRDATRAPKAMAGALDWRGSGGGGGGGLRGAAGRKGRRGPKNPSGRRRRRQSVRLVLNPPRGLRHWLARGERNGGQGQFCDSQRAKSEADGGPRGVDGSF
jgi:hypothetical protein